VDRERWLTTFKGVPTEPGNSSVVVQEAEATPQATFVVESGQPDAIQEGPAVTGSSYSGESEPFDPDRIN
jgi:hypothetical protein